MMHKIIQWIVGGMIILQPSLSGEPPYWPIDNMSADQAIDF